MSLLLENKTTLEYALNINLYFDDKTEKHVSLKSGDTVVIMYRSNGDKIIKTGVVKSIVPVTIYDTVGDCKYGCSCCETCKSSAMIKLDSSKNHQSEIDNILSGSILDIDIVEKEPTPSVPSEPEETV